MGTRIRILLQTTIEDTKDDWTIDRFSLLSEHLSAAVDEKGQALFEVTSRNREIDADGNDRVLSNLHETNFDELWLFAVDQGNGLTVADCQGITRFRQRGGGVLTTRDHQDLGSSLCSLGGLGQAHFFHSRHKDPDQSRQVRDDQETPGISWPNYPFRQQRRLSENYSGRASSRTVAKLGIIVTHSGVLSCTST